MEQIIIKKLEQIRPIIEERRFLLVHSGAYKYLKVKEFFDEFPHVEFSGFTPNPLYEQVCEGVKLFNEEKCEMIIAVGGGSAIDVAKCIKLYCKMNNQENYLQQETFDSGVMLIAVPTTAGSGSESTRHAVIYYKEDKQSISHISIVPDYAVLEAAVLKTLPDYQKKCTMMDALSQAIESWWSVNSTDTSIKYSIEAIKAVKSNWEEYIFENTEESAERILEASNLAGRAINITATTAAHAMSYKITSMYELPHGHAVAVCLPEVWEYMMGHVEDCIDCRGAAYLQRTLDHISTLIDVGLYRSMLERMEMKYPVSRNKVTEVEALVNSVNPERLKNSPVGLSADALGKMYGRIVQ
jgi:Alcohol dehydrogenase, class IV